MPFITIDTNAPVKATSTDLSELVNLVSAELGKPKDYIVAKINTGKLMSCGASVETIGCRHAGRQCCQGRTHFWLSLCVFAPTALPKRRFCVRDELFRIETAIRTNL